MLRQAATTFHRCITSDVLAAAKGRPKGRPQGELRFLPSREATNLSVQNHVFIQASDLDLCQTYPEISERLQVHPIAAMMEMNDGQPP